MIPMNNNPANTSYEAGNVQIQPFDYIEWREQFILFILRIASVLGIFLVISNFPTASFSDRVIYIGLYVFLIVITALNVPYLLRVYTFLLLLFMVGANAILVWGPWQDGNIFLLTGITLASLLLDRRADIYALISGTILMVGIALLQQEGFHILRGAGVPITTYADWIGYIFNFALTGAVIIAAIRRFKGAFSRLIQDTQTALSALGGERSQLEQQIRERTSELETRAAHLRESTSIAKTIAETRDINELLEMTTRLTSEKFGYYHVGLFMLDEQKQTVFLQAASSAAGKLLIGQSFRIEPGTVNAYHLVLEKKSPIITTDAEGAAFLGDPNFPLTRSRMLLPLSIRGDMFGILDIHSDQPQTFGLQEADILQTLAELVAIYFDNARLISDTRTLVSQLEANTSLQTQQIWKKMTNRKRPSYLYTPAGVRPVYSTGAERDEGDSLRIPLILYGQRIGVIKLKRKGRETVWSKRELALLEKIAEQVALALENSRLVDEAQKSAARDQMIANVSTRIRETLDMESVVRTAAAELRRVFDLKEAEVVIGPSQSDSLPFETS
jgi:GAF domain-containing protein